MSSTERSIVVCRSCGTQGEPKVKLGVAGTLACLVVVCVALPAVVLAYHAGFVPGLLAGILTLGALEAIEQGVGTSVCGACESADVAAAAALATRHLVLVATPPDAPADRG